FSCSCHVINIAPLMIMHKLFIASSLVNTHDLLELGILLTIETGLRVGELCTLKRDCVFKDCLKIQRSEHRAKFDGKYRFYVEKPKKNKTRTVQLNKDAKEIVTKILDMHKSDWLFPGPNDDSDWMRSYYFDKAIRKVCKRLRLRERSMHKLRKTYASYLFWNEVPEKLIQEQLGHADISTTHRSYHYNILDEDEKTNILGTIHIG
ncbi:MAG: site-specific integrase, partial [Lachnospiraceae bacterium]|nr:site-specific integrase [Lachnospiraceae bacterium]